MELLNNDSQSPREPDSGCVASPTCIGCENMNMTKGGDCPNYVRVEKMEAEAAAEDGRAPRSVAQVVEDVKKWKARRTKRAFGKVAKHKPKS